MSYDGVLSCHALPASLVVRDARTALVVDDDPEAREILRNFLTLCGLSVLEARNGLEALLSVKRHRPGVVILDLNMPRLGGLEALKRIRQFDPSITVVVISEDADAAIDQRARALGASLFMTKPVDLARFGTALGVSPADPQPIGPVPRVEHHPALRVDGADAGEGVGPHDEPEHEDCAPPTEGGLDRDDDGTARGFSWLVGAVRGFLGAGPALEGVEISGRPREEVDEPIPGKKTMSYWGILGLTKEPFSTSPDPAFFYEAASHKAVLYRLQIAIKLKRGLSLVFGDVGMGKTTLSRRLFQILKQKENVSSHLILNPVYETEAEFLMALVKSLGIAHPAGALPISKSLEILEGYLFEKGVEEERTVVLLIDEAQRLSSSSLELLRALLNYETNEYKLLQLILMGQMELLPRIKDMKNLWDRISLKCVIDPLDEADTEAMIAFRLQTGGYAGRRNLFTPEAIREIYRHTQGSPRRITALCHDALEQLVISDKNEVDGAIIRALVKQEHRALASQVSA